MACCNAVFETFDLTDPENPVPVIGLLDADAGTTTYLNPDGTPFTGDEANLGKPEAVGQELTDCTGSLLAAGAAVETKDELVASGVARPYLFVDSGDGCSPADRGGCLDQPGVVNGPFGYVYQAAPGVATWEKVSGPTCTVSGADSLLGGNFRSVDNVPEPPIEGIEFAAKQIEIVNPTCDVLQLRLDFWLHAEQYTPHEEGGDDYQIFIYGDFSLNGGQWNNWVHRVVREHPSYRMIDQWGATEWESAAGLQPGVNTLDLRLRGRWATASNDPNTLLSSLSNTLYVRWTGSGSC